MTTIIKAYYENAGIAPFLLKRKLQLFERNHDIAEEFVEWIKTGKYPDRNCVCIEGFTAKMIASKSPLFAGEGAYMMLIELREKPENAKVTLNRNVAIK